MKVVFVQLSYKTRKIGVFEHSWKDGFGEFVHVFDDETVALRTPRHDVLKRLVLEHPIEESV